MFLQPACTWSAHQDNWSQGKNCWCCQEEELKNSCSVNCNKEQYDQKQVCLVLCCGCCFVQLTYTGLWSVFSLSCRTGGLFLLLFAGRMKLCLLAKAYCLFHRYLYPNLLCRCSWAYYAFCLHNLQAIITQEMFRLGINILQFYCL